MLLINNYIAIIQKQYRNNTETIQKQYRNNTETEGGVIYLLNTDFNLPSVYKIGKTTDFKSRLKTH
jgi:hypothetical protein